MSKKVVEQRLGQVALLAELAHERRAVALRVGLALRVDDHREVAVGRGRGTERLEEFDVLERILHVVVAADDVRHALVDVIHHVRKVEDRRAVRTHDREVGHVLGLLLHVALHDVVERNHALLGHAEHHDLARFAVAGGLLHLVGAAVGEELLHAREVAGDVLRLVKDRLVVVEPQPFHAVEEGLDGFRRGPLEVGILHAQKEFSSRVARVEPVVDGGADVADMDFPRRRRGETNANL